MNDPAELEKGAIPDKGLVSIDLGLKCGFALYSGDGRLLRFGSHNFGSRSRLRRGAGGILTGFGPLDWPRSWVVGEGDRTLGAIWQREATHLGAGYLQIPAEEWRAALMPPRLRRNGPGAKRSALRLAAETVSHFGLPGRRTMRHDAAEAILLGLYAVQLLGLGDG